MNPNDIVFKDTNDSYLTEVVGFAPSTQSIVGLGKNAGKGRTLLTKYKDEADPNGFYPDIPDANDKPDGLMGLNVQLKYINARKQPNTFALPRESWKDTPSIQFGEWVCQDGETGISFASTITLYETGGAIAADISTGDPIENLDIATLVGIASPADYTAQTLAEAKESIKAAIELVLANIVDAEHLLGYTLNDKFNYRNDPFTASIDCILGQ
jgi:hypothetical protein